MIQVILGPRQVGKTTGILQLLQGWNGSNLYHYATADDALVVSSAWIEEQWQQAVQKSQSQSKTKSCLLVIDEIQKIPQWSSVIKKLWDRQASFTSAESRLKVVLLGSSSFQIQSGLIESLAGRFELIRAFHWDFRRSKNKFGLNWDQYLRFGGYPGTYKFIDDPDRWRRYVRDSIVNTVIDKDILNQAHVKSPALFKQCFLLAMSFPAQEISYNKLLGQLQSRGNVDLVKYYLDLFEWSYLLKTLQKYSGKSLVKRSSSPKIVPLCPALIDPSYTVDDPEKRGRVFESVVGAELLKGTETVSYWRNGDNEVDYVVESAGELFAIEVKSGRKRSGKGLAEFKKHFPKAKILFITEENFPEFAADQRRFFSSAT